MTFRLNQLSFSYGDLEILKNISYTFEEGGFYGIIGPNGSGKTTLLKLLAHMLEGKKECIFLDETDIRKLTDKQRTKQIAYVPQIYQFEHAFSVYDVVAMGRYPHRKGFSELTHEDIVAIEEALRRTELTPYKDRLVNELSGGELQRVILARSIAQETKYILMDEPISHLDIHHQLELLNLSKGFCLEQKKTVICVLHDLNLALKYCNHALLLKDGEIYAHGPVSEVITPKNIQDVYGIKTEILQTDVHRVLIYF